VSALRGALSIIDAVSGGRSLWLATCNSIGSLSARTAPALHVGHLLLRSSGRGRARGDLADLYLKIRRAERTAFMTDNWTGAEIKECCRKAYRLRMSLRQSAEYIVPVARSAADQIESLRQQSSGKYLSASHPGVYEYNRNASTPKGRAFRALDER